MSKTLTILLSAIATIAVPLGGFAQGMPVIELSAGMYRIEAEVAVTQENRMLGLMHRKTMAPQKGMLFVFDGLGKHCMWMRNTLLPLAVAFVDDQAHIVNVEEMVPQTDDNHCAAKPVRYALEMNAGWFHTRGFGAGSSIAGLEKAPPAR